MEKLERAREAVQGGIVLGQDQRGFLALPAEQQQRIVADITANTLLAEAKNMISRAGMLFANEGIGYWVDQEKNVELATRCEMALRVLDARPDNA